MSKPTSDGTEQIPADASGPQGASPDRDANPTFRIDSLTPGVGQTAGAAPKKSKLSAPMVFLTLLVVAGGGVVLAMRQVGIGPIAAFSKVAVPDYDTTGLGAARTGDHAKVLKDLSTSTVVAQVPPEQVQKNPFRMSGEDKPKIEDQPEDKCKKEAAVAIAGLQIHGILGGSNPVARLAGRGLPNEGAAVRVGDAVGKVLTVRAIRGRAVDFEACGGTVYTISLDDEQRKK